MRKRNGKDILIEVAIKGLSRNVDYVYSNLESDALGDDTLVVVLVTIWEKERDPKKP